MKKKKSIYIKFIMFYCWLEKRKLKIIAKILYKINRILFSNDIPPTVSIGENFSLPHYGLGVVIHPRCIIGNNVTIYQNVTIGCRNNDGPPIIEDNCLIGAGACILGKVRVEKNSSVGANAVVTKDVKRGKTVVGVPAREIKRNDK